MLAVLYNCNQFYCNCSSVISNIYMFFTRQDSYAIYIQAHNVRIFAVIHVRQDLLAFAFGLIGCGLHCCFVVCIFKQSCLFLLKTVECQVQLSQWRRVGILSACENANCVYISGMNPLLSHFYHILKASFSQLGAWGGNWLGWFIGLI